MTMSRLLIVLSTLMLLVGCARDPDRLAKQCAAAQAASAAYDALLAAGHTPSEGEILAVAAVRAFIAVRCAGTAPPGLLESPAPAGFTEPTNRFQRRYNEWRRESSRPARRGSGRLGDRHQERGPPRDGWDNANYLLSP